LVWQLFWLLFKEIGHFFLFSGHPEWIVSWL
jgi:hypothetical protein